MGMTSIIDNCSSREYNSQVEHFTYSSQHNICTSNIQSNKPLKFRLNGNSRDSVVNKEDEIDQNLSQIIDSESQNKDSEQTSNKDVQNKMVKSDQPSAESSPVFRDLLQNRENLPAEEMGNNNNVKDIIVNGDDIDSKVAERSGHSVKNMLNTFNGSDNEQHSINSGDLYMDDSNFSSPEQMDNGDDSDIGDGQYDIDNSTENGSYCNEDSKEAKRARVENILSSMKHSPLGISEQNGGPFQEARRPKRKQYQPQQHEAKWLEHSGNKYRKIEQIALQEQLLQLQHQLQVVQKRYIELYDEEQTGLSQSFLENFGNLPSGHDASEKVDSVSKFRLDYKNNKINNSFDEQKSKTDDNVNIRSNLLKQAVSEPLQQLDVENLANSLKSQLANAVSSAIDTTVNKFLEERSAKLAEKEKEKEKEKQKEKEEKEAKEKIESKPFITPVPSISASPHREQFHDHIGSMARILEKASAFEAPPRFLPDFSRTHHHPLPFPLPFSYFPPSQVLHGPSLYSSPMPVTEPEQTEALPLVVNTPKKKRTKVTDTRLSPRAARALLQDTVSLNPHGDPDRHHITPFSTIIPPVLPTSVAIPNPSLQHSDVMGFYRDHPFLETSSTNHSPLHGDHPSPSMVHSPSDGLHLLKSELYDGSSEGCDSQNLQMTSTLTPMHLRKAKLMFFYVRYPSSAILKIYFPDVKFNKNNTAQLVKWFSNFREFYYIQMEKYARQAMAEGCKHADDLVITNESELYRVLNLHYNRNNQIDVPDTFRLVVQGTLREFFKAISTGKDQEPSWKKAIYKVIARMDDGLPEFFKSVNWMDQLGE